MKQKVVTRSIIKRDGKVLLVRRAKGDSRYIGTFELPGVQVAPGENPEAAIIRGVQEEVGLESHSLQLHMTTSWVDIQNDTQYIVIAYLGAIDPNGRIELGDEYDKFVWKLMYDIQLSSLDDLSKVVLNSYVTLPGSGVDHSKEESNVVYKASKESELILYADGGSRGNPGPSASGFILKDPAHNEAVVYEGGNYLGITTNNQAEYQAVRLGLEKALGLGARVVAVRLDSQLVVNQLTGVYQIKNRDLWPIHEAIKDLIARFDRVTFTHVYREFNHEADAMVNKVLDEH